MKHVPNPFGRATVVIVSAFLLAGCLTATAAAAGGGQGRHYARLFRGLAALDLSEEQRGAIRGIFKSERSSIRALLERMREERGALQDAISADTIDETLIRSKVQELSEAAADLALLRARIGARIRGELSQDQRRKLAELKGRRQQRARARAAAAEAYLDVMTED